MAIVFGNCSAITTCNTVKEPIAKTHATDGTNVCGNHDMLCSGGPTSFSMNGSPSAPKASEAMVMPSWDAERYGLRSVTICRAALLRRGFSFAIISIWLGRTFTNANSAATNNALRIRKKTIPDKYQSASDGVGHS